MKAVTVLKLGFMPVIGLVLMLVPFILTVRAVSKPAVLETRAPGRATFTVYEPGKYTVWRTIVGTYNNEFRVEDKQLPPGLSLSIRNASDGSTVPITARIGSTETVNEQSKASLVEAELAAGKYELISSTAGESIGLVIKSTTGSLGGFFTGLFIGIAGFLLFFGGLAYALVYTLRKSLKKRQSRLQ